MATVNVQVSGEQLLNGYLKDLDSFIYDNEVAEYGEKGAKFIKALGEVRIALKISDAELLEALEKRVNSLKNYIAKKGA